MGYTKIDSNQNSSSEIDWEKLMKLGILGVALLGSKKVEDSIVDYNRREFLDHLPMQDLGWIAEQQIRSFYRKKKIYCTQFPDTHPKVFPVAARILYGLLLYHGNKFDDFYVKTRLKSEFKKLLEIQKQIFGDEMPIWSEHHFDNLLDHDPSKNLAHFLNSEEIRDLIFSIDVEKDIDVVIYSSKLFGRIEKYEELEEEYWTLEDFYPYLKNRDYIIHIFDAGGYDIISEFGESMVDFLKKKEINLDIDIPENFNTNHEVEWFYENFQNSDGVFTSSDCPGLLVHSNSQIHKPILSMSVAR